MKTLAITILTLLLSAAATHAADYHWVCDDGDFSAALNLPLQEAEPSRDHVVTESVTQLRWAAAGIDDGRLPRG